MRTSFILFAILLFNVFASVVWSQSNVDATYDAKEILRFMRYPFDDSLHLVRKGDKYGIVNGSNELQVPVVYDQIKTDWELREVGLLEKMYRSENEKIYYYWENGWESQEEFDSLQKEELEKPFSALSLEKVFRESPFFVVEKSGLWGVINGKNKVLIPFEYVFLEEIGQDLILGKKNGTFDVLNPNNEVLVSQLDTLIEMGINKNSVPFGDEFAAYTMLLKDGKFGALNNFNGTLVAPKYEQLEYIGFLIDNGWIGAFDKSDINYGYTPEELLRKHLYQNVLIFRMQGKFGLLNTVDMEEILPAEYNFIDIEGWYNGQIVQLDSMYTFLCDTNSHVFEDRFDSITLLDRRSLFRVVMDGKVGVFDPTGTCLAAVKYEDVAWAFYSKNALSFVVKHNGKYGAVNGKGKFIIRPKYDAIIHEYDKISYKHFFILERKGEVERVPFDQL